MFPVESASKEASTIRTIGYAENLTSSTMISHGTHSPDASKKRRSAQKGDPSQPVQERTSEKKKRPATQGSQLEQKRATGKKKRVKRPAETGITVPSRTENRESVKRKRYTASTARAEERCPQGDEEQTQDSSLWKVESE
jgi:hypothetical protein